MRTEIDEASVARYRAEGFVHLPGLLDRAEVDALRKAVLDAIAAMGRRKVAADGAALVEGDSFYDRVFTQRLNLWRLSEPVRAVVAHPAIGRMIARLEGIEGVRIWHDQALIKEPFANPTALHLDVPYWSFHSRHACSIWIALEDATLENGCLCFLPGSHRLADFRKVRIGEDFGGLVREIPALAAISPVPVPMKAGDCSVHNGLTAHGAGVNMTSGRRIALTCAYMPDGATFNGEQNVLPDHYVAGLRVGDRLDCETYNPLVWPDDARKGAAPTLPVPGRGFRP